MNANANAGHCAGGGTPAVVAADALAPTAGVVYVFQFLLLRLLIALML